MLERNTLRIQLSKSVRCQLLESLEHDSVFLKNHNIMDYSLLLAVEAKKKDKEMCMNDSLKQSTLVHNEIAVKMRYTVESEDK